MKQGALFADFPIEDSTPANIHWQDRASHLARISERVGGLIPVSLVPDVCGISRQRAYQLIASRTLQKVEIYGYSFVSGQSIKMFVESEKTTGRGNRRGGFWNTIKVCYKLGLEMGDVISR